MKNGNQRSRRTKRLPQEEQAMVSGGTKLFRIIVAIVTEVVRLGGEGKFAQLDKPANKAVITELAEMIVGKVAVPVVQVRCNVMLGWIIAACRFTAYTNPNITAENFPFVVGDLDIKEVQNVAIPWPMSTKEVRYHLDSLGLRPATLVEVLWWWLTHPEVQSDCLVVALGSDWNSRAPCVKGNGDDRQLSLSTVGYVIWSTRWTFAAVGKSAAKAAA